MNQEPDDLSLNTSTDERGFDRAPHAPQPSRPLLSPQEERLARLRELRRQRQDVGTGIIPLGDFKRRGLPAPPPEQPPLQDLLKHWWQHGPFSGRLPSSNLPNTQAGKSATRRSEPPVPALPTPYEERAKELIAQGRKGLSRASAKAQAMMSQAKDLLNQKMHSQPQLPTSSPRAEEIVPGMIIVGFAPEITREQAIKEITALGGRALRHKASQNLFQVAVPPGHELALMQQILLRPGVLTADIERVKHSTGVTRSQRNPQSY